MSSLFQAITTIVFSLFIGAVLFALCAFYAPEFLEMLQIGASGLAQGLFAWLTDLGTEARVNVWIRFLVQDQQLVFMLFVVVGRILIALLFDALGVLRDIVAPPRD